MEKTSSTTSSLISITIMLCNFVNRSKTMNNPNFANRSEAKIPSWRDCQLKTANLLSPLHSALCLFLIFNFSFLIETQATIRYVSKTGTSTPPYTTWETAADSIQKAIDICLPGDTVLVANGVYYENLVINTPLNLIGSSMDSTIIDGRGLGDFTITLNEICSINLFNVYGKGLSTIQTASVTAFSYLSVENCRIQEASDGVAFINSGKISNCIITDCRAGLGLAPVADTCKIFVNNNLITLKNTNESGIRSSIFGHFYIANNIILGINSIESGISIGAPRKVYINNNLISGFACNIYFDIVIDTAFVKNNILSYNKVGWPLGSIQSDGNHVFVKNVILPHNKVGIDGDSRVRTDYNIFWENNVDLSGIIFGDSDRVVDPMFVKDTLPNSQLDFDYHLQ